MSLGQRSWGTYHVDGLGQTDSGLKPRRGSGGARKLPNALMTEAES